MPNFDSKETVGSTSVYTIKTGLWKQNSYIIHVEDSSKLIVVDPGGEELRLEACINDLKGEIDGIYLTHAHHDHVGGLKHLCEKYNKNFNIHESDFRLFRRAPMFAISFESRELEIPKDRERYYENDIFSKRDVNGVLCIKSPGHTAGGVIIDCGDVAFTGDTLLNKLVGRTDLPGACPNLLAGSIETFLNKLENNIMLFPGHGDSWTVKEAKKWWEENKNSAPEYREKSDGY